MHSRRRVRHDHRPIPSNTGRPGNPHRRQDPVRGSSALHRRRRNIPAHHRGALMVRSVSVVPVGAGRIHVSLRMIFARLPRAQPVVSFSEVSCTGSCGRTVRVQRTVDRGLSGVVCTKLQRAAIQPVVSRNASAPWRFGGMGAPNNTPTTPLVCVAREVPSCSLALVRSMQRAGRHRPARPRAEVSVTSGGFAVSGGSVQVGVAGGVPFEFANPGKARSPGSRIVIWVGVEGDAGGGAVGEHGRAPRAAQPGRRGGHHGPHR